MPDTPVSRQKIRDYSESKEISLVSAVTYLDILGQGLIDYLNGKNKGERAHKTLLTIIDSHKIR